MRPHFISSLLLFSGAISARTIGRHLSVPHHDDAGPDSAMTDILIDTGNDDAVSSLSNSNGISPSASCYWSGTSPFCAGSCDGGYQDCATSSCGDGACCVTGYKKYCCRGGCNNLQGLHQLKADPPRVKDEVPLMVKVDSQKVVDEAAPSKCYWDGTSPFCAGGCSSGYSDCGTSSCGDGACCVTGYKKYCCRGGCQSSSDPFAPKLRLNEEAHKTDGDNDDLCKDSEFICCAPGASRNKECKCISKDKIPKEPKISLRGLSKRDGGQLCKEKQLLCCNPGAEVNDECACVDE